MSMTQRILRIVEPVIFGARWITLAVLIAITAFLGWQASQLQPNAGWLKMVPQEHPYMETFLEYYDEFGGANTVLVALKNKEGDIYQPAFMEKLRKLTDEEFDREVTGWLARLKVRAHKKRQAFAVNEDACRHCRRCEEACPEKAIAVVARL